MSRDNGLSPAEIVGRAVRNNVAWYELMFRAHGVPWTRGPSLWRAQASPPRYHSWGVALVAGDAVLDELAALQEAAPSPRGIKASFDGLDLRPYGLVPLFSAQWIYRAAAPAEEALTFRHITGDAELARWEAEWAHGDHDAAHHPRQFPPVLLADPSLAFVAVLDGDVMVAGCALNASDDVVGLSNTFVRAGPPVRAWRAFVAAAAQLYPGRAIVGYERGDDLESARAVGFEAVGPLTVWTG